MGDKGEQPKPTIIIGSSGQAYENRQVPDPLRSGVITDRIVVPPEPVRPVKPAVPQPNK
jgi:hypothetical protein